MLETHSDLFKSFAAIHEKYTADPQQWQKEFNETGLEIMQVIRRYENMLCGKSEAGKYGKFSSKLSDKFWTLVRSKFPKIDFVGTL